MFYSIILPYFDPGYRKTGLFTRCVKSIVQNTKANYELVVVKDGPSYVESHNRGLKYAKGDYLIILNDDVEIQDPEWVQKLTDPEAIVSWRLGQFHLAPIELPDAVCFGMSRATFEKLGYMDEQYKNGINYEDTDYFLTAKDKGIPFKASDVKLDHKGYATISAYSNDDEVNPLKELNRKIFFDKWKM